MAETIINRDIFGYPIFTNPHGMLIPTIIYINSWWFHRNCRNYASKRPLLGWISADSNTCIHRLICKNKNRHRLCAKSRAFLFCNNTLTFMGLGLEIAITMLLLIALRLVLVLWMLNVLLSSLYVWLFLVIVLLLFQLFIYRKSLVMLCCCSIVLSQNRVSNSVSQTKAAQIITQMPNHHFAFSTSHPHQQAAQQSRTHFQVTQFNPIPAP